jgi:hypothetical protein
MCCRGKEFVCLNSEGCQELSESCKWKTFVLMMMLLMNFLFFGRCCFSILMRFLMLFSDPECGTQCPNCKSAILYRSH